MLLLLCSTQSSLSSRTEYCAAFSSLPAVKGTSSTARGISVDTALRYKGVKELLNNRGKLVDLWNKFAGNALGSPYCAAFVSYCLSKDSAIPFKIKSGLARTFWTKVPKELKHSADDVLRRKYRPKYGDLVIWANGSTMTGHIGFVISYDERTGIITTIEANTSSGKSGSQSNGNGVYVRYRKISRDTYFHIIGFVETE